MVPNRVCRNNGLSLARARAEGVVVSPPKIRLSHNLILPNVSIQCSNTE